MNWFNTSHGIWNTPINPLGNYEEPAPRTMQNKLLAHDSKLPDAIWWWLRNPLTNFCDFWAGLLSVSDNGDVIAPSELGWSFIDPNDSLYNADGAKLSKWVRPGSVSRPYFRYDGRFTFYIGWRTSGSFGIALRRR